MRTDDDRGQLGDLFALVVGLVVLYGVWALAFRFFYPPEESIVADGVLAVRSVFIDALGPSRGAGAFLATVLVLALFLNVVVFTDYIGPNMIAKDVRERTSDE
ncbi:hypothetical protein HTZ84_22360 [Haloterrigena sp. SYSU A558-1]|uniref:Uncharacterized protein n=1 Tax=Haloterrigena gelatinilytica TaxID=2741724 RepID=A0ABX2LH20_9EURY|nr:hypothetical protein [Haloterrigena gelatinilytica]NUC75011.1 hypothetical protein [Haloterrigena gelatinilytica]